MVCFTIATSQADLQSAVDTYNLRVLSSTDMKCILFNNVILVVLLVLLSIRARGNAPRESEREKRSLETQLQYMHNVRVTHISPESTQKGHVLPCALHNAPHHHSQKFGAKSIQTSAKIQASAGERSLDKI